MASKKGAQGKKEKFVLDTITDEQSQNDFYLRLLRNKYRNNNKKLKEITDLQEKSKTEELKQEQIDKISKKEDLQEARREINYIATLYIQAKQQQKQSQQQSKQGQSATAVEEQKVEVKTEVVAAPAAASAPSVDLKVVSQQFINILYAGAFLTHPPGERFKLDAREEEINDLINLSNGLTSLQLKPEEASQKLEAALRANQKSSSKKGESAGHSNILSLAEQISKSEFFQNWNFEHPSTKVVEHVAPTVAPTTVPVATTANVVAPVTSNNNNTNSHVEEQKAEVESNTKATHSNEQQANNNTHTTQTSANTVNHAPATSAPAPVVAAEDNGANIEDDDDQDRFVNSEDEEVKATTNVKPVVANNSAKKVEQKEKVDDGWITVGKKKEETNNFHHRPAGVWKGKQGGGFDRPYQPRRPKKEADDVELNPEERAKRDEIRKDRERRGSQGEYGKRSNQRRAKESGNVRVPEYIPKDQLDKQQ